MTLRRLLGFATIGLSALLPGCISDGIIDRFQLKPDDIIVERRPDTAYQQLFPYYVELCAASRRDAELHQPAAGSVLGNDGIDCSRRHKGAA